MGALRAVYHGTARQATLRELTRTYQNVVEDATRVMLRLKALFRARGIKAPGKNVYHPKYRAEWLAKLPDRGVRYRAETLYAQLDVLRELRPKVKTAMVAEARRDPAWPVLQSIPFLGPVRVALLLATMRTPWRFRTKRNLWAYCGLAVVSFSSSDYTLVDGRPMRRRRAPMTRGLNRNHNRVLKDVFKSAATAATGRPGPLQDFYQVSGDDRSRDARGTRTRDAHPQARGTHPTTLENRRTLRSNEADDASALASGSTRPRCGAFASSTALGSRTRVRGAVSTESFALPAVTPRHSPTLRPSRRTRKSVRPAPGAESQIEPWFAERDPHACTRPPRIRSSRARRTMRKKTDPPAPRHQEASQSQPSGLIAKVQTLRRSEGEESALDNRSHRTDSEFCWRGPRGRKPKT